MFGGRSGNWKIEILGTAWNTRLSCSLAIPKKFRCSFEVQSTEFWWVPTKLRCSFELRSGDSRVTQIVAVWDWVLPNTKVRYSTRSSTFEGACGAKWLGTRTMCPEGTVADITLHYTILYYTILYIVLDFTILYYTIPYCIIRYHTIFYYTILLYTILYCTILSATVPSGHMVRVPRHLAPQAPSKAELLLVE